MSFRPAVTAVLAAGLLALGAGSALADNLNHNDCFLSANWQGWKSPDPNTIYLRISISQVYRLDLSAPSYSLNDPNVHLQSTIRGSNWICSPLDLQLYVADTHGVMREPLFVKRITRLTPEEAKAIPPKFQP